MKDSPIKSEILTLTSLRFIAALYVFLFHCHIHFGAAISNVYLTAIIRKGQIAMSLFFILSGYILSHVYKDFDFKSTSKYYVNRFARIYPTYIFYGLITLPFLIYNVDALHSISATEKLGDLTSYIQLFLALIAFLFMFQAWLPNLFGVWNFSGSWSLSVEAFFYLLFPYIRKIINKSPDIFLLWLLFFSYMWVSISISYAWFFSDNESFKIMNLLTYTSPIFRLSEFIVGILFYVLSEERKILFFKRGDVLLLLVIFCFICLIMFPAPGLTSLSFIAIPTFAWAISWLKENRLFVFESRFLVYGGHISYSFYLAQFFIFLLFKENIKGLNIAVEMKWLVAFFITLVISIIVHHFIENRFRILIRTQFS